VDRASRCKALGYSGATIWLTGLPASGKSTIAAAVEERLVLSGRSAYRLDGDQLRMGLNRDLGFDWESRTENIRRTAEVARILADAGVVVLVSVVSPYSAGRASARALHEREQLPFIEVWVSTPLSECERRDPKGLYARARRGELSGMTGIDAPYEPPADPDLVLTPDLSVAQSTSRVLDALDTVALPGPS
jgi:adenylyl-sulfate kinase